MRWKWVVPMSVGLASLVAVSFQADASLFEPVRDRQLVCEAPLIVHGQVTDVQAAWDEQHTAIWTTATVEVKAVHRGKLPSGTSSVVKVKEVGGTVDGYTIHAEGFPTFHQGEEVVMLLRPWDDDPATYRVWGYARGMFKVERNEGRGATATRYDVVESGRPTMFTDRIPPTIVLEELTRELAGLAASCGQADAQ